MKPMEMDEIPKKHRSEKTHAQDFGKSLALYYIVLLVARKVYC